MFLKIFLPMFNWTQKIAEKSPYKVVSFSVLSTQVLFEISRQYKQIQIPLANYYRI